MGSILYCCQKHTNIQRTSDTQDKAIQMVFTYINLITGETYELMGDKVLHNGKLKYVIMIGKSQESYTATAYYVDDNNFV